MGVKLDDAGAIAGIASLVVAVLALLGDQASLSASARQRFRRSTGLLALGLGVGSVVWGAAVLTEKEVPSRWQDIVVWPAVSVGVGVVMLIFGGIRFLRTGVSTEVETLRTLATSVNRRMVELDKRTRFDPARYVSLKVARGYGPEGARVDAEGELSKTPGGDPRVLLGPPGSGKSMVLRHLTKVVCQRVRRDRRPALMAVYVDLRGLDARHTVTVDVLRGQLEASVATGDKTVARRLTDLLQAGLHTPRWLLLFDSLDELAAMRPAAAEECLTAVRALCDSDAAFTAVIATRDLDIVNRPAWPLLTLAPLSGAQQRTFGERAGLSRRQVKGVVRLRHYRRLEPVITNPLLLGLLCTHLRDVEPAPAFIDGSALLDETVRRGLRELSETAATAALQAAQDLAIDKIEGRDDKGVADLAAIEPLITAGIVRATPLGRVEFAHTVIRDHFAASGLARVDAVWDAHAVIASPAWRGAAASVLRQGEGPVRDSLLLAVKETLEAFVAAEGMIKDQAAFLARDPRDGLPLGDGSFRWPPEVVRALRLVVDGAPALAPAPPVSDEVRDLAGHFMISAFVNGAQPEQLQALDFLTVASSKVATTLAEHALSGSKRLRQTASERLMDASLIFPALPFQGRWKAVESALEPGQVSPTLGPAGVPASTPLTMPEVLRQGAQIYLSTAVGLLLLGCYNALTLLLQRQFSKVSLPALFLVLPAILLLVGFLAIRWQWPRVSVWAVRSMTWVIFISSWFALFFVVSVVIPPTTLEFTIRYLFISWLLSWPAAMLTLLCLGVAPQRWRAWLPQWQAVELIYPLVQPYMKREALIAVFNRKFRQPATKEMLARVDTQQLSERDMLNWFLESRYPEADFTAQLTKKKPEVLQNLAGTIRDLVRALEHVRRMVPAQTESAIPGAIWDLIRPDFPSAFKEWLIAYDRKYPGRLLILVAEIYDDLSDTVRGLTAPQDSGVPRL